MRLTITDKVNTEYIIYAKLLIEIDVKAKLKSDPSHQIKLTEYLENLNFHLIASSTG